MINHHLAIPKTVLDLIDDRNKVASQLRNIERSIMIAQDVCKSAGEHLFPITHFRGWKSATDAIRDLDRSFWRRAMALTGIMQYMDKTARAEFDKDLEQSPPEFNESNVRATLIDAMLQAKEFMNRGIVELFKNLSGNYKTNDAFKVGKKIILQRWFTVFCGDLSVNYQSEPEMADLDRVLRVLDGREFQEHEFYSALRCAAKNREYENDYVHIKMFKNGNAHLWFKRLDLIEKVNEIIADWYGSNAVGGKKY